MRVARAAEAPLRARAGGGVASPLLLPFLGDPVDMADILAVRRVTLSSSSSIGGPAEEEEEAPGRGLGGGGGLILFFENSRRFFLDALFLVALSSPFFP